MKRLLTLTLGFLLLTTLAFGTVTNTTLPPKQYNGNDVTTDFPITFDYNSTSDLIVSLVVDATGAVTVWVLNSDYTVVSDEVIASTAPATGETLVIDSETAITQSVDLKNNRATAAEVYEAMQDKITIIARDNAAKLDRAIVAPATGDPDVSYVMPDYEASSYLQWHPTSKELRNATPVSVSTTLGTDVGDVVALVDDGAGNGIIPEAQRYLIDEDDLSSDVDDQAPTQQSVKAYVDDNAVFKTGNQTVAGVKTFSSSPIVPTPTTATQAASKSYVDSISPKGFVNINGATGAINYSYNVTSVTRNSTGTYTITWDTDFADTNYIVIVTCFGDGQSNRSASIQTKATGSTVVTTITASTGSVVDATSVDVIAIGTQ